MIGLLKKPLSICQSGWKEIRNALPVIRWVRRVPTTRICLRRRLDPVLQWRKLPSMNTKGKGASNKETKALFWKHYRNTDVFSKRKGMWHHNITFSNTLYNFRYTILLDYKYYIEYIIYIICVFFLYNDSCNYDWPKLNAKNQRLIGKKNRIPH